MRKHGTLENENRTINLRLVQNNDFRDLVRPHFLFKASDGLERNWKQVVRKDPTLFAIQILYYRTRAIYVSRIP